MRLYDLFVFKLFIACNNASIICAYLALTFTMSYLLKISCTLFITIIGLINKLKLFS
jgi:hypothetical protein